MVGSHSLAPGAARDRLGFAVVAASKFRFLLDRGFRQVEGGDTLAQYETSRRLVRVVHGRGFYELGVQIGRWIAVDDGLAEQAFSLHDVIALEREPAKVGPLLAAFLCI